MKTKQAVAFVLKHRGITKYALAKSLGAAPVSVNQWLNRTRMSKVNADLFYALYKVPIDDAV